MDKKDIWVVTEYQDGGLKECAVELLCDARVMADQLSGNLCAILIGNELPEELVNAICRYPVDSLILIQHPLLEHYNSETFISALSEFLKGDETPKTSPALLLLSATPDGQDSAPRLAARLKCPVVTDCVRIRIDPDRSIHAVKPTYQDKVYTTINCGVDSPVLATIRPGVIGTDPPGEASSPEIIKWTPSLKADGMRTRVIKHIKGDPKTIDIREAEFLVVGGKGAAEPSGWVKIEHLADVLSASVAGTRMALDYGYIDREHLVGQTGKNVKPRLYISAGVSGTHYHIRGVNTEHKIAIDIDRSAQIFKSCSLGILGNLHTVLPALSDKISRIMQESQ
jgi:electron transfer flavoprotein alpha subunit